jgi:hypothetical protein
LIVSADDITGEAKPRRVKHDAVTTEVVVRQYRLLDPLNWGDDCEDELRRMTALWNRLVEIDRESRARYRAATADDPEVKALRQQYDTLTAAIDGLIAERKAERAKARKRVPTPELDDRIAALKTERRPVVQGLAAATKQARVGAKGKLDAVEEERREAVKLARQTSRLYWGNYNAVCDSYERGRKLALSRGGEMQFRRHTGEGRLVNQIQGGMSIETLLNSAHSQVRLAPQETPRRLRNGKPATSGRPRPGIAWYFLTATAYRTGRRDADNRTVTWPLIMDRPLPEDGAIKSVVVSRRRIEAHWHWSVSFTCTRPAAAISAPAGRITAVDLGWRKTKEGLRVATVMQEGGNGVTHVMLPHRIIEGLTRCDRIRGHRDRTLLMLDPGIDAVRFVADPGYRDTVVPAAADPAATARAFLAALPWEELPEALQAYAKLRHAPKIVPAQLARLAIAWREHSELRTNEFARLEAWRKRDKHLWLYEANGRDQAAGHRLDLYRKAALDIVAGASVLILEDFDLAKAAQIKDDRDHPLQQAARRQRVMAGVHLLRDWLIKQAKKRGVPVEWHEGVSTWRCSTCGRRLAPRNPALLDQQCPHCSSHAFDQDAEACRNMLAAYRARADVK